jgi:phosphoglycolate phosphatase-like HAD superfamily hydrolase
MVRLVLFDIDGTLIHTGGAGVKAFGRAFASEFNLTDGLDRMKFAGRTDTSLVREFFSMHGVQPDREKVQQFFDCYVFWLDYLLHHSAGGTCPGLGEFVQDLRQQPQPPRLGLLTGNIRLGAEIKLRHFDLWELFQTGAFGDDHEDRNQIALIALQRGSRLLGHSLRGDEILVIGDTPLDIDCARAIGAKTLAVASGGSTYDQLKAHHPDWVVENLTQAKAAEICV